ncbi:MAG TPA: UDP-3-O-acyl-N-acetylglucosamine deacetylase, partial [Thermohalobaculum sp.]|nr:UDP-3-O-acyl-N-acetylglucosamine deacetylase [Thermohalobaculum sp.]
MRRTIATAVHFRGVGLHCGQAASLTVSPARAGTGLLFRRTDLSAGAGPVPARHDMVCGTLRSTCLANADGVSVATVEHLMAALGGAGITDALIELDGPEVPAMDGSALPFLRAFIAAGFTGLPGLAPAIRILKPVEVLFGGRRAALLPAPRFEMDFTVDFTDPAIGRQRKALVLAGSAIAAELSDSRTFAILSEVEHLRRMGLGRGGSLENTVVIDRGRVLNQGGLRHPDEFLRHKMLDAVGDLALAGAPVIGRYVGHKAGHALTNRLLHALFAR